MDINNAHPNLDSMEKPKSGSILLAEPFLGDPNFDRSVVFLTEHNDEGTVGYVLNRPLDLKIQALVSDFPDFDTPVFSGGPVEQENLYFLHSRPDIFDQCIKITETVYWGGDFELLKESLKLGRIAPNEIRFFLGYSGWGSDQLYSELAEKSWTVLPPDTLDIFNTKSEELWRSAIKNLGGDYKLWANAPSDPLLN